MDLWEEDWLMRIPLIASVLFGGFLAETALPAVAAQTQKQTPQAAAPVTAAPQVHKHVHHVAQPTRTTHRRSRGTSHRRNVARGAVGGAAGGAILGGRRGAVGGALLGGTAGSLTHRRR